MRVGIAGITGRMGQLLIEEARAVGDEVTGGTSRAAGMLGGIALLPDIAALAASCDVVIDFSNASTSAAHAQALATARAWGAGQGAASASALALALALANCPPPSLPNGGVASVSPSLSPPPPSSPVPAGAGGSGATATATAIASASGNCNALAQAVACALRCSVGAPRAHAASPTTSTTPRVPCMSPRRSDSKYIISSPAVRPCSTAPATPLRPSS